MKNNRSSGFAPRFALGRLVATPAALATLRSTNVDPMSLVRRHVQGDWGDLDPHDRHQNEFGLRAGLRLLSSYTLAGGERIWIITEADRTVTTVLLPEDY